MKTVQLDSKKLLGYRIAFDGMVIGAKAGLKQGSKKVMITLGAKRGGKTRFG